MAKNTPTLLLLPNLLGEQRNHELFLPASVDKAVATLDGIIAESEKGGRAFLSRFETKKPVHLMPMALLNKRTQEEDLDFLLEPVMAGERWGVVSDAGLPCVADPGSILVARARERGVRLQAFVGPSSVTMSLMLSGFPAQRFSFNGYVARDQEERSGQLRDMEMRSRNEGSTQIFIEAPHKNQHTLETLLESLAETTKLCVAWDLTLPGQGIVVKSIREWKKMPAPNINKKPAIFLLMA